MRFGAGQEEAVRLGLQHSQHPGREPGRVAAHRQMAWLRARRSPIAGPARPMRQQTRPPQDLDRLSGRQDLALGHGGDLALDPGRAFLGEGGGVRQGPRRRRDRQHLTPGEIEAQGDAAGAAADLHADRHAGDLDPVAIGQTPGGKQGH